MIHIIYLLALLLSFYTYCIIITQNVTLFVTSKQTKPVPAWFTDISAYSGQSYYGMLV